MVEPDLSAYKIQNILSILSNESSEERGKTINRMSISVYGQGLELFLFASIGIIPI